MLGLAVASTGLQLPTGSQPPSTRRALLSSTAAVAALALPGASFAAVKPCKSGAQNCFSTAGPDKNKISQWVWPSDMSRADATASLKTVLSAYPQAGQDGVDGGGWTLTTDTLADKGFAAFEFKSSGTGNMAKFFNGGKPFVDDLELDILARRDLDGEIRRTWRAEWRQEGGEGGGGGEARQHDLEAARLGGCEEARRLL